jgi:phosphoglycolate phosphatase-like HAD superfamily hydrolase
LTPFRPTRPLDSAPGKHSRPSRIRGLIFDIDGTLIDTNPSHVEAWRRAFQRLGYDVPPDRIAVEIGKGGDVLIPSILGEEAEQRDGEALRKIQKEEFLQIAKQTRFRVFRCVPELFQALRARHIRTALVTSSNQKHLQATFASAGLDLTQLVDELITKEDADASKPAPDLVIVGSEKLAVARTECALVGDTIYDGQACQVAGIAFIGVLTGCSTAEQLLEAGACGTWRDTAHIYRELDQALEAAARCAVAMRESLTPSSSGECG